MGRFDEIIPLVRQGSVSLFIGAGFSLKAGAPKVDSLKRALIRTLPSGYKKGIMSMPLDDVAQEVVKYYRRDRTKLFSVLEKALAFSRKDMTDHVALSMIPHFKRLFTTNYDTLLEEVYGEERINVVSCDEECANPEKEVNLYKIHGDLKHPNQLVITRDDYDDTISTDKNQLIWNKVYDAFAGTDVVFIGYSLEDTNVQRVLNKVFKCVGEKRRKVFLIAPGFSDVKIDELRHQGVVYIDALAEVFLKEVTYALKDNVYKDLTSGIVSQDIAVRFFELYHLSPVIECLDGKIIIKSIRPTEVSIPQTMQLSVPAEIGKTNNPLDFDFENQGGQNSGLEGPSICYEGQMIRDFEFRINGVKVMGTDEIGKVLIGPTALKEGAADLIAKEIGFIENVPYRCYRSNDKLVFSFDTALCELRFSWAVVDGCLQDMMLKTRFKDDYGQYEQAKRWTDFLAALFDGKEFEVTGLFKARLNPNLYKGFSNQFRNTLTYYNNVREIELLRGKTFEKHKKYEDGAIELSLAVLHMISGDSFNEPLDRNRMIEFAVDPGVEVELPISTIYTDIQARWTSETDLILNDESFGRVTVIKVLPRAHIDRIYEKDGNTIVVIAPDVDYWMVRYIPAKVEDTEPEDKSSVNTPPISSI